jgi:hypothetical protein
MRFPRLTPLALLALCVAAIPALLPAQAARPLTSETDLVKDPGGPVLAHLSAGTAVVVGAANGAWLQATMNGWVVASAVHEDRRDGFEVAINAGAGTSLRELPGAGATHGTAKAGALFNRVETRNGWVHVRRSGWIAAAAFAPRPPATVTTSPPVAKTPPPAQTTVNAGATLSAQSGGAAVATLEAPLSVEVLERRGGWTHVRVDAWVHDAALGNAPAPGGITAAEIRAAPDKYVGQTVEWTIQVIGVQKADDLRPELPAGQPYLLARGPLPESGFVYVAITNEDAEVFRRLEPLAKIRIRATIRAGRSRFLPTPVLNLVRRLDQEK